MSLDNSIGAKSNSKFFFVSVIYFTKMRGGENNFPEAPDVISPKSLL